MSLTKLEIGLAITLVLILLLGGLGIYEHYHLINEGIAKQKAADEGAVQVHDQQVADRHAQDLKDKDDVIKTLRGQLQTLATAAPPPGGNRSVRLCNDAHGSDAGRPAQPAPGGAQPAQPANGEGDLGVRAGAGAGADIGPGMRDLALAGQLLADYSAACIAWAHKQSEPLGAPR